MEQEQLREVIDRILTWPEADQEKVVRFVDEIEELGAQDDRDME